VEFRPHLVEVYSNAGTLNTNRSGSFVEEEPRNALLLFAEPLPKNEIATRTIPNTNSGSIFYPVEGDVHNLDTISQEIIFFKPGNYFMPWNYSAQLPKNVKWVYFAPGSYVKGAIQFLYDNQPLYKVTGFGVLSGEKYVYEPDKNNGYQHRDASQPNCHGSCVKMLQFASSNSQQSLDLQGLTITEPPYHSFVVYGNDNTFKMHVENYKQVGSWYWQTDGIELYSGSTMRNTFFHSNDDVLKLYHSDVSIDNTVIWKNENGPVIQWGWAPRNISDVVVKNTSVIHNRMSWNNLTYNTGVINSSSSWQDMNATNTADLGTSIKNITIDGITVEGAVNCALRLYALSNTENIIIKNLHIDRWSDLNQTATQSIFKAYTNSSNQPVSIGNQTAENKGIKLINYKIGSTIITKKSDNWRAENIGKLNFDSQLWNNWDAWVDTSDTGSVTSTAFLPSLHSLSNIGQNHSTMIKIIISSGPKKLFVPEGTKNIEIFNMLGKKIVSRSNPGSRQCWIELSRESITMGVYLVKCARTFGDW
jgi:hypothetical protein